MNHADIQNEIPDYAAGRLDNASRVRVEVHLVTCRECEQLLALCEEIPVVLAERDGKTPSGGHSESSALRRFARNAGGPETAAVASHIRHCDACSTEVEIWKSWVPATATSPSSGRPSFGGRSMASRLGALLTAAAIGAGVMFTLVDRGAPRLPSGSDWHGVTGPLWFEAETRGDSQLPWTNVSPGQPTVPFLVYLELPTSMPDDAEVRFSVRDSEGRTTWEGRVQAAEVRRQMGRTGLVVFLIPTETHPAGRYRFEVGVPDSSAELFIDRPFELRQVE